MDEGKTRTASGLIPSLGRCEEWLRHDAPQFLLTIGARISRDNIFMLSAGVAFYIFVAIPSGLTTVVALYSLVFNPVAVEHQVTALGGVLPKDVISILSGFLKMLAARPQKGVGVRLLIGLLVGLWSAQSAASSMITALNAVYEKQDRRTLLQFEFAALALAFCSILFALAGLLLFAVAPLVFAWIPLTAHMKALLDLLRWPALAVLITLGIAGIYRFAPAPDETTQRWGLWGVTLTTIVWIGSSALFALYVANVATYDVKYGTLGGVVVLLLWLYIAVFVVLLGAEVNAELDSRHGAVTHHRQGK